MLPRLALLGVVLVLAVGLCGALAIKIGQPYAMGASQWRQISQLRGQLGDARSENEQLAIRCASLDKPEGIEVAARGMGYLRKGEERLVLENDPAPMPDNRPSVSFLDRCRSAWFSVVGR